MHWHADAESGLLLGGVSGSASGDLLRHLDSDAVSTRLGVAAHNGSRRSIGSESTITQNPASTQSWQVRNDSPQKLSATGHGGHFGTLGLTLLLFFVLAET